MPFSAGPDTQRWQSSLASRLQFQNQQIVEFRKRHLKTAVGVWQAKLKQKTIIRIAKRDADRNVKKDACASGENEYASHLDHKVADRCWNTGRGPLFRDIVSWA